MKILDDWKVYGGVSDLKQHMEGIPVSQVIINSNYSDDHDDYDIALMKLSRPLTLSGEALRWLWAGGRGSWGSVGFCCAARGALCGLHGRGRCGGEHFLHPTLLPSCRAGDYGCYFAPG